MSIIKKALDEDIGKSDLTTEAIIPAERIIKARLIAKESGVIAGLDIAKSVFQNLDKKINYEKRAEDGDKVSENQVIAELSGNARAILTGERVALNFLQRLSGIATLTSKFVDLAGNTKIKDTRKTTPCLRKFEKYAVRKGGGVNHRFALDEAILIKDNHINLIGSIKEAVSKARKTGIKIEVEAENLNQVKEAIEAGADIILLDNMTPEQIRQSIKLISKKTEVEISGGVNLGNIKEIANLGADCISIGALTHSAKALDISLEVLSE